MAYRWYSCVVRTYSALTPRGSLSRSSILPIVLISSHEKQIMRRAAARHAERSRHAAPQSLSPAHANTHPVVTVHTCGMHARTSTHTRKHARVHVRGRTLRQSSVWWRQRARKARQFVHPLLCGVCSFVLIHKRGTVFTSIE